MVFKINLTPSCNHRSVPATFWLISKPPKLDASQFTLVGKVNWLKLALCIPPVTMLLNHGAEKGRKEPERDSAPSLIQ